MHYHDKGHNSSCSAEIRKLNEEIERLNAEIKRLQQGQSNGCGTVAVEVILQNKIVAEKYQRRIESYLRSIMGNMGKFSVHCAMPPESKCSNEPSEPKYSNQLTNEAKSTPTSFYIDKPTVSKIRRESADESIKYDSPFANAMGYEEKNEEKTENKQDKSVGITCFNCLGNHHLKNCPEAHNGHRIASNKKNLLDSQDNSRRYHQDDKNGPVKPGFISDNLRTALNLRPDQLPFYIYNMRLLGYPPGWMKAAEIRDSGLNLYNSSEKSNNQDTQATKAMQYDAKKFVEYPGFNSPVPNGIIDESQLLQMPPLQSHQLLSEALKHTCVTISPGYKKRKMKDEASTPKENSSNYSSPDLRRKNSPSNAGSEKQDRNEEKISQPHPGKDMKSQSISVASGLVTFDTGNPYIKLPDCNKFAAGVSEHMNYENLPDAVGSYGKIRGLLDDVRKKLD